MAHGLESCEEFFRTSSPPDDLSSVAETTAQFIHKQHTKRPVVLVTVSWSMSIIDYCHGNVTCLFYHSQVVQLFHWRRTQFDTLTILALEEEVQSQLSIQQIVLMCSFVVLNH